MVMQWGGLEGPTKGLTSSLYTWSPDGSGQFIQPHSCVLRFLGNQRDGGVCAYHRWQCREPLCTRFDWEASPGPGVGDSVAGEMAL